MENCILTFLYFNTVYHNPKARPRSGLRGLRPKTFFQRIKHNAIIIQFDINNIQIWCNLNHLLLNVNKCKCMRCYLIKYPIDYQSIAFLTEFELEFKDLAIIVDTKLHISLE